MAVDFTAYKAALVAASKAARRANSIDAALEIQATGYAAAFAAAVAQMEVPVVTNGGPTTQSGVGTVI